MTKHIIFFLDDEESIGTIYKRHIELSLPEVEVYTFTCYDDLRIHPLLKKASLFVYDIILGDNISGADIALDVYEINQAPVLFISGIKQSFEFFNTTNITYDFVIKSYDLSIIVNRIKVLLKVSKTYYDYEQDKTQLQLSLKEVFAHSNLYVLVLDEDFTIQCCSVKLANDLGYESNSDLEGKSWLNYIKNSSKDTIKTLHAKVYAAGAPTQNEAITPILKKDGEEINVKWFYSLIENGQKHCFNIGNPISNGNEDSIESIRGYWKQAIKDNNAGLKAIKNSFLKHNEK